MKKCFLIILIFPLFIASLNSKSLIKNLETTGKHNTFISILEKNPLFLSIINNTVSSTIFAPTDDAFEKMPNSFRDDIKNNNIKVTTKLILSHIFSGDSLKEDIEKNEGMVLSLDGSIYYTYEVGDLFVKDIVMQGEPFIADNFRVIPVECVMFLQLSSDDRRLSAEEKSSSIVTSCCLLTDNEIETFINDQNL